MDIARPSNLKKKRIRQAVYAVVGLLVVGLVSVGLSRLKPAAPTVERNTSSTERAMRKPSPGPPIRADPGSRQLSKRKVPSGCGATGKSGPASWIFLLFMPKEDCSWSDAATRLAYPAAYAARLAG